MVSSELRKGAWITWNSTCAHRGATYRVGKSRGYSLGEVARARKYSGESLQ
jgi:hypothetical protein